MSRMSQALTKQRVRIQFAKFGVLRFIGHLDLARTWERVLKRAGVPLEYTRGFNPRPRFQFAAALPVGVTSESELLDVWLTEIIDLNTPDQWIERLNATSPAGLRTLHLTDIPIKDPALPTQVTGAEYVISLYDTALTPDDLWSRAQELLARDSIIRKRRKKTYDLRPLIQSFQIDADGNLIAVLSTGEKANARADEVLDALGLQWHEVRVHRRRLLLE